MIIKWLLPLLLAALFPAPSLRALPQEAAAPGPASIVALAGQLTSRDPKMRRAAAREIDRRRDPRVVPCLIELLRFRSYNQYGEAQWLLEKLTGQSFGGDWRLWHDWLMQQPRVELPPQFTAWKAALFQLVDPHFGKFLAADAPLRIRVEEIVWGGVKKDGIPALTNPKLVRAGEADYLRPQDLVFGVALNGEARAYPHRLMDSHEMLNDVIRGQPVSLAYCTLCRSGILFETRVDDGRTFTFGSSGLLYRSNKLMYDHQTESLWLTIPGEPVSGALAHSGITLKKLPLVVTTWADWRGTHPDTLVLALETGYQRDYRPGALYSDYFASPELMFPAPRRDRRLPPKEEVFALIVNGQAKAYALKKLRQARLLNDELGGEKLVLIAHPRTDAVRAYLCGERLFRQRAGTDAVEAADGSIWSVTEAALVNRATGERLPRLAGHLAYWFGWAAFYPRTLLYGGQEQPR
jgi:hypothetical protein